MHRMNEKKQEPRAEAKFRCPVSLWQVVKAQARANKRSINSTIVHALVKTYGGQEEEQKEEAS